MQLISSLRESLPFYLTFATLSRRQGPSLHRDRHAHTRHAMGCTEEAGGFRTGRRILNRGGKGEKGREKGKRGSGCGGEQRQGGVETLAAPLNAWVCAFLFLAPEQGAHFNSLSWVIISLLCFWREVAIHFYRYNANATF